MTLAFPGSLMWDWMVGKAKPDLSGIFLKLDRAKEHIETVRCKTSAFREREPPPFDFRPKKTPRPDKAVDYVLYAIVREAPPRELAPIIGDVVHNIRSALDHLAYELAPPKVRKTRETQFPIFMDECHFKVLGTRKIKGITGDERALIERVQPYAASNPPSNNPLAILNKLSNLDKHRLLVPIIAAVDATDVWVASSNADVKFTYIAAGPVKHDAKIVGFTARPHDPSVDMDVQPQSGLQLQLGDTGDNFGLEVVALLTMLHQHVRRDVIGTWFEYGYLPRTWGEVNPPR